MQSGSLEATKAKLENAANFAKYMQSKAEARYDAERAGLLQPEKIAPPERRATKSRLTDKPGSFTLRDMAGDKRSREQDATDKSVEAENKRKEKAQKKEDEQQQAAALIAAFERCESACACGKEPCPFASGAGAPRADRSPVSVKSEHVYRHARALGSLQRRQMMLRMLRMVSSKFVCNNPYIDLIRVPSPASGLTRSPASRTLPIRVSTTFSAWKSHIFEPWRRTETLNHASNALKPTL